MTEQAPSGWYLNDNRRENMLTNGELRDWLCGHEIKRMTEDEQRNFNATTLGRVQCHLEAAEARIEALEDDQKCYANEEIAALKKQVKAAESSAMNSMQEVQVSEEKMKKLFAQITALEQENAALRKQLTPLEAENEKLRQSLRGGCGNLSPVTENKK